MSRLKLKVATALTVSRALLIPPILMLLVSRTHAGALSAFILFALAVATDFLDGFIARTLGQESSLGRFLDPLCDKLLIYSLALFFVRDGKLSIVFVLPIFVRDLVVDVVRSRSAWGGRVLPANRWGKIKFNLQAIAIAFSVIALLVSGKEELFAAAANITLGAALAFSLPGVLLLTKKPHNPEPAPDEQRAMRVVRR